ncbi:MAG: DsbA family protein [Candidatus Latescibacteria bacterium]|nr:DsbA family protein [Candidatus Latescibacterota bacterium]
MCSWCWGFQKTLEQASEMLPGDIPIRYVMGGLAKDSDEPMPEETKTYIQGQWRAVTDRTGAEFNWDFWERCEPRRSTYPSCRAVIAAGEQFPESGGLMYHRIQRAYYLEGRNPSDMETLVDLAEDIGLDKDVFTSDMASPQIEKGLQADFALRRSLAANQFPSLVFEHRDDIIWLASGYDDPEPVLDMLSAALVS